MRAEQRRKRKGVNSMLEAQCAVEAGMISLERLQKNRSRIVWFTALFLVLLFFEPFKVTNPTNPFFNPDRFRFSDYRDQESLRAAFRELFPPGTSEEFVDRVLIDAGGAVIHREFESSTQ